MDYVSTMMGDCLSALLVSLLALQFILVHRNPIGLVQSVIHLDDKSQSDTNVRLHQSDTEI